MYQLNLEKGLGGKNAHPPGCKCDQERVASLVEGWNKKC